ncbi:hypothetical protein Trydic_g3928 [Trypoxylus dichotomus]
MGHSFLVQDRYVIVSKQIKIRNTSESDQIAHVAVLGVHQHNPEQRSQRYHPAVNEILVFLRANSTSLYVIEDIVMVAFDALLNVGKWLL